MDQGAAEWWLRCVEIFKETMNILMKAVFALYNSNKFDIIVEFFIADVTTMA
jgi:hypothetical protein